MTVFDKAISIEAPATYPLNPIYVYFSLHGGEMSANPTVDDFTIAQDERLVVSLYFATFVILLYDYLLTFGDEVTFVWIPGHASNRGARWFFFVRYLSMGVNIAMLGTTLAKYPPEMYLKFIMCNRIHAVRELLLVVQQFTVGCTIILRVYAMYDLDKRVLACLLVPALVTVGVGVWSVLPHNTDGTSYDIDITFLGCHTPLSRTHDYRLAAAWGAELGCETIALCLTIYRSLKRVRVSRIFSYSSVSLWEIMARDGVMYFSVVCLANLANILMYHFGDFATAASLGWPTASISLVMITRMMLHLHAAAVQADNQLYSSITTRLATLEFADSL
ncbi:hypothetical protein MVEN_02593600 [Mycena venus]|uniref:DUF6533 domain-containing protein n=1 Tax=Mycena venus TaxID=2733690 RepID=A0A8H6WRD2_9AGAR|nr:hypothetical protein MVEN_02593600 [Mycena venus]